MIITAGNRCSPKLHLPRVGGGIAKGSICLALSLSIFPDSSCKLSLVIPGREKKLLGMGTGFF